MSADLDRELVNRARQHGDRAAFDALVERHWKWVHRVCTRLLRSDDRAQDATQDAFTRAFERLGTLRGDNFAGWLKVLSQIHRRVQQREHRAAHGLLG